MDKINKKAELRLITGVCSLFMIAAVSLSTLNTLGFGKNLVVAEAGSQEVLNHPEEIDDNIEAEVIAPDADTEKAKFSYLFNQDETVTNYIIIPKPDDKRRVATITDNYVYHTIFFDIEGDFLDFYHPDMISRVVGDKVYKGEPVFESAEPYLIAYLNDKLVVGEEEEAAFNEEVVDKRKSDKEADSLIYIKKSRVVGSMNGTRLALTCNKVYVPELFEDEKNYYISLKRPKDVYEKIVVVDAGHGGRHPGTFSLDGKIMEKDTTLNVVSHLKDLFDQDKEIKVYYTRLNDATVYLRPRADLANQLEADFFVSVHNNAYFNNHAYGTEVLYNEKIKNLPLASNALASTILEKVTAALGSRSRGLREGSDKYVLGHTNMMSALIEIGYLTNEGDLSYILDEEKMKACAKAIYESVLSMYKEMEK